MEEALLGDEAIALGAIHAGLSAAWAYPGTPSTEIMEYLIAHSDSEKYVAQWCANEKTAYETALGASFAGLRTFVCMKHVGLNVAADPFINSALLAIHGGLVVAVADDPGMHSSQNEQDSRALAQFAKVPCLEPSNQQEAYDMTRQAFDISEKYHVPVMLRITTRLAHARAIVSTRKECAPNKAQRAEKNKGWNLMPVFARQLWKDLLVADKALEAEACQAATVTGSDTSLGIITCGLALAYFEEVRPELGRDFIHLHIGRYPLPADALRQFCARTSTVLVLEEGWPLVESALAGVLPHALAIHGKLDGSIPATGELDPDIVRTALGLSERARIASPALKLPGRPPKLCPGCPHIDSFTALNEALSGYPDPLVTSDIGCYTIGSLPPLSAIETCVDMGASIGMARGIANSSLGPAVAVIGDSTFYHSGLPGLLDALRYKDTLTLIILDNATTAMTGTQDTIVPSTRLVPLLKGMGVERIQVLTAHKKFHADNVKAIKEEVEQPGVSVIILERECIEVAKKARTA